MTVIVRADRIIIDIDGDMICFDGKRTVTGFCADISTAKALKAPEKTFSGDELDSIVRAVREHSEGSYLEVTFE